METYLKQLREEVNQSDLSLWELSKRTGLKVNTIADFARRGRSIRASTAEKIAAELGISCTLHRSTGETLGLGHASATTAAPRGVPRS